MSVIQTWGSTVAERAESFPCDPWMPDADDSLFRAVDVDAPVEVVFRWLCQLRAAPYSYDLLDNLGRRSPRELTPGLDMLAAGQRVMTIFKLIEFERDHHITLMLARAGGVFGEIVVTYRVTPRESGTRLVVKMLVQRPRGVMRLVSSLLPAGDLIMMRKQLLTLKQLAEQS